MGAFETPPAVPSPPIIPPPIFAPPITGPSGSAGADPGSISTALNGIVTFAGALASWLQGDQNALFGQLQAALKRIVTEIQKWLQRLKDSWLGQVLTSMWDRVKTIYKAIAKELKKIITTLQTYERMVEQWETKVLKPALNLIQRLRRVLVVFRLFHFKFADQLDAYLAAREAQLSKLWLDTRKYFNMVIDYLDLIFDPFGYFNAFTYLATAARSAGQMIGILWGAQNAPLSKAGAASAAADNGYFNADAVQARMSVTAAEGPQPADLARVDRARAAMNGMGYHV